MKRFLSADFIRNFTFGVEDSLVSTVGLISGVAIADMPRAAIVSTGIILIFVEAFSMSVGSFLSDNATREFENKNEVPLRMSRVSALVMFLSYFISGFVILFPYLFLNVREALPTSVVLSLLSLFILGVTTGKISGSSYIKKGITMVVIGGLAVAVGLAVGSLSNFIQI